MNDEIKFSLGGFSFTWDDAKAIANFRKHKVTFEIAAEVFADEYAVNLKVISEYYSWYTLNVSVMVI